MTQPPYDDTVRRAAGGDPGAFEELVGRFRGVSYACAVSILGDPHLAEDAVQDAFVEAHRSLPRLADAAAFPGWLRSVVRHTCARRLRRRDVAFVPLGDRADVMAPDAAPEEAVLRRERQGEALAAVRSLPRPLREAVTVFHLCGCTQREAAAFLAIPVTTLNNRLHQARALMKRRLMDMGNDTAANPAREDDFAFRIGRVLRVDGFVVDAQFGADRPPEVFDMLRLADGAAEMRVAQVLDDGVVRCMVSKGATALAPGQPLTNATAEGGVSVGPFADADAVARAVAAFGHSRPEEPDVIETGIKSVDLFSPLPLRGNVGLFGTAGTGKMVLTEELAHRLRACADAPRLVYLAAPPEPAIVRDMRAADASWPRDREGGVQRVWLLSDLATDPTYSAGAGPFDATVYCSLLLGAQGLWPATDPFHSASRAAVSPRHADVAARARAALAESKKLMTDPVFLEFLACRAFPAARRRLAEFVPARLAELGEAERVLVGRARRLERFLTTPFFVAEEENRRPGRSVPLAATLDGAEAILDGAYDDVPEARFVFIGAVTEVRAG